MIEGRGREKEWEGVCVRRDSVCVCEESVCGEESEFDKNKKHTLCVYLSSPHSYALSLHILSLSLKPLSLTHFARGY